MRLLHISIILTSIVFVFGACKEYNPDNENTSTINDALYNEWGASEGQVVAHLSHYSPVNKAQGLITVNLPNINATIGYQFLEGKLCATLILSENAEFIFQTRYQMPTYLGDFGVWSVFAHMGSNTLVLKRTIFLSEDKQLYMVGFAPITSDSYSVLSPITVITGEASSVSYYSATVSGSAMGYSEQCETGIIYGESSSSLETKGTKVVSDQHDSFRIKLSNLSDNTTYYYKAYVKEEDGFYYGDVKSFETQKATSGELNGHSWVDLGLPSGLRWATQNVGSSYDADYKDYYAWGMDRTTSSYGVSFYDYYDSSTIPSNISGTTYDVARQKWGESWRIPTFSEFNELKENCSFEWTTRSGIKGAVFTGPNGNTIFLPAAGGIGPMYSSISSVMYAGEKGMYWSATLASRSNGNMAKYFYFSSSGPSLYTTILGSRQENNTNAFNGMQIRPVTNGYN